MLGECGLKVACIDKGKVALLAVLMFSSAVEAQSGGAKDLGDLGKGPVATATLVNDAGAIVGTAQTGVAQAAGIPTPIVSPFFKASGAAALRNIAFNAPTNHFQPVALNGRGVVAGTVSAGSTLIGSKRWDGRAHQDVPSPPEYQRPQVRDIDDAGNLLITATQQDFSTPFLLSAAGVFTEIGCPEDRECVPLAMNEKGVIVGYTTDGQRQEAVVWERPTDPPRALQTPASVWSPIAVDVNAEGVIIGNASMQDSVQPTTALLVWTARASQPVLHPNSEGRAINDRGQVVGASWNKGGGPESGAATVWDVRAPDGRKVQLQGLAADQRSVANDINNAGVIVGSASDGTGTSRAVVFATGPQK